MTIIAGLVDPKKILNTYTLMGNKVNIPRLCKLKKPVERTAKQRSFYVEFC
jgi:hypothetical protein